jgi:F0F1-type ATP synthase membrane subunit b/b'
MTINYDRDQLSYALANALRERDEWAAMCERYEQERDEAREQIKELIYIAERAIALAEIDFENDKFGVVSELRDGLERIKESAK